MKQWLTCLAVAAAGTLLAAQTNVPPPSAANGTLPPPQYITDYYAPPPDWVPAQAIADYTLNTRVPDLFWLKYDGAYTLALRIRPMTEAQLKKAAKAELIDLKKNPGALRFSIAEEAKEESRRVGIRNLDIPADDLIEFSFKMKATAKAKNPAVKVAIPGVGEALSTDRNLEQSVDCLDGFRSYRVKLPAKPGAVLRAIEIQLPATEAFDPAEEYVFFDLNFKRRAPKPRFTDLPKRQWIKKSDWQANRPLTAGDGISDIVAFVNSAPAGIESMDLPLDNHILRPQGKEDKDDGFTVEKIKESIDGKSVDALRITLTKGSRCYLKFPVKFDATKFNTMTFLTKIELPIDVNQRKLYGDDVPMLHGTDSGTLNSFFDTFSFGVNSSTRDYMDWNRMGVSQGLTAYHRQRDAKAPAGWTAVALDIMNSDPAGNKSTFYPEVTDWCFYYDNRKLTKDQKVVVTIAMPKVSSGLMLAGGDMELFRKFMDEKDNFIMKDFSDGAKNLGAPANNRLARPLPFLRNHAPVGEIILPRKSYDPVYAVIVDRAVLYFQDLLKNKYGLTAKVPVFSSPSSADNVKIFLGDDAYAEVNPEIFAADRKALAGTPGFAIRSAGKNIYIYGGEFNYAGSARGIANGLYFFLENNTDEIMANSTFFRWKFTDRNILELSSGGDMDLVWGDGVLMVPPLKYWSMCNVSPEYNDRNMATPDKWETGTWNFGGKRQLYTNHSWSYGAYSKSKNGTVNPRKPNDKWGLSLDGKRIVPGCYSSHPCLINVMEDAKDVYLGLALEKQRVKNPQTGDGQPFSWKLQDTMGLWVEDTLNVCQCEKCLTPIRLANGSLVKPGSPEFRGTQFFSNACAMINYVNVHAKRDMRIESIAYFWMSPIPLFEISRNYTIRFCPYIRKSYALPIYAPMNDLFWRDMYRWSQMNVQLGLYEYFLFVNLRPWASVFQYDLAAHRKLGLEFVTFECQMELIKSMELWTLTRLLLNPSQDPKMLRKYYIDRTYREAAPEMEKFFFTIQNLYLEKMAYNQPMEFDDGQLMALNALLTKSAEGNKTVLDELNGYLDAAHQKVKNPRAVKALNDFQKEWEVYSSPALKHLEIIQAQSASGK